MANNTIKNLSMAVEIPIEGTNEVIKVDFSDTRFVAKLLKLVRKYRSLVEEIQEKFKKCDDIKDNLDKVIALFDIRDEILLEFKHDVDNTFNTNLTEKLFGDCVPDIERYFVLFDALMPHMQQAKEQENTLIDKICQQYGLNLEDDSEEEPKEFKPVVVGGDDFSG